MLPEEDNEKIDPEETYYPESELVKTIKQLDTKIERLREEKEDPEVRAERAKNRTATVKDLEEERKRTIEELKESQRADKEKEEALKRSTERYQSFKKEIKDLTKTNGQSWTPGKEKTLNRVLNDVSREAREEVARLRKEGDKTARVDWEAVDKEVKETLKDAFGWDVTDLEDEYDKDEDMDKNEDRDEDENESDDKDDRKEKSQARKPLKIFSKSSGDVDLNNKSQMRQIQREIEHMSPEEAISYRDKLMSKLDKNDRKKLYNREIRNM